MSPAKSKIPKDLVRIVLKGAGYAGFFLFCFILFSYWLFPYDRLRDYLLQKINQPGGAVARSSATNLQLKAAELSPWRLSGVHVTGVELVKPSSVPGKEPIRLSAEDLWIRIPILSLLSEGTDLSFEAAIGTGNVEGSYQKNSQSTALNAELRGVDAAKLGLGGLIGLPVQGLVDGSIGLSIPTNPAAGQGKIKLKISKLKVGDGKSKLVTEAMRDGLTVETIDAGDLEISLNVRKGLGEIEKLASEGSDLKINGSGTVRFAKQLESAYLNLAVEFKFSNAYKNRNDRTRALFDLMNLQPQLRRAISASGALRFQISGTFLNLRAQPARRSERSLERPRRSRLGTSSRETAEPAPTEAAEPAPSP